MHGFKAVVSSSTHHHHNNPLYCHSSSFFHRGTEEVSRHHHHTTNNNINDGGGGVSRYMEMGEIDQHSIVFNQHEPVDLSRNSVYTSLKPSGNASTIPSGLNFGPFNSSVSPSNYLGSGGPTSTGDAGEVLIERRQVNIPQQPPPPPALITAAAAGVGGGVLGMNMNMQFENRGGGESGMGDSSQQTDTSTDVDTDERIQGYGGSGAQHNRPIGIVESTSQSKGKIEEHKTLRRLAQNREAARKSRLRKKAYVQELETSRLKLAQLEQELEKARQQGFFVTAGYSSDPSHTFGGHGALAFELNYSRWLNEHQKLINELRSGVNSNHKDEELRSIVNSVMLHYGDLFKLKGIGMKTDIFYMLSGMWNTPAERFFMWLGGFRSSEVLKILVSHLEPLTDQQLMGFCTLQQSSQQAEDALSQGMEALQQSLVETLSSSCLGSGNVADYMGQMAIAMGKLTTLENFAHQADLLRHQTLQRLHRILTTRQAARAFLVIHDYTTRLRALSSLWLARPKNL